MCHTFLRRCFLSSPEISSNVQLYQQSANTGLSPLGVHTKLLGTDVAEGNLASIYYEQSQLDMAILHYKQAINCDSTFIEAYNNLTTADGLVNRGNTFKEIGRVTEAIQDYIHAVNIIPTMPEAHANLASAYKDRVLQDVPILVMVSMLAYFCFLEQLLSLLAYKIEWVDEFQTNCYCFVGDLGSFQFDSTKANMSDIELDVHQKWIDGGNYELCIEDVRDEIWDMVKPVDPLRITLADLLACKQGGTVASMLVDVRGFWAHDNRENLLQEEEPEEE
ncbi:hypothetical protein ZIOFF_068264 [Zingiber officinale]|uniref:Uncharacterized protein n=1 Tax=Zingiber officinale TaxID=94328 RepID=A0A8J5CY20_ZINOF|nr:hypothetical protein ZIOFF_068264 [Zingiber officinale]